MLIISFILLIILLFCTRKIDNANDIYSISQNLPIRGVLVLLVISNHLYESAYMLGNIAVSLFFCFSGYGLMTGYLNKKDYFNGYIIKKIKNILFPFFIFNILYIIWNLFVLNNKYTVWQIVTSFFNATIMPVGWYIIIAFILYLIFYFVFKYLKISNYKKITVVLLFEVLLMFFMYILGCGSWWYCSIYAFPLGILMALKHEKNLIRKYIINKYIFIFSLLTLVFTYIYAFYNKLNDGLTFLTIKVIHSILICIIYFNFSKKYKINNKILSIIGKNSLIIYMVHPLIYKLLYYFKLNFDLNILNFITILIISLLSSLFWNLNIKFIGEKFKKLKRGYN